MLVHIKRKKNKKASERPNQVERTTAMSSETLSMNLFYEDMNRIKRDITTIAQEIQMDAMRYRDLSMRIQSMNDIIYSALSRSRVSFNQDMMERNEGGNSMNFNLPKLSTGILNQGDMDRENKMLPGYFN